MPCCRRVSLHLLFFHRQTDFRIEMEKLKIDLCYYSINRLVDLIISIEAQWL